MLAWQPHISRIRCRVSLKGENAGTFVDFSRCFTICLIDVAIHTRSVSFVYNVGLLSSYSLRFAPDFSASLTFSLFSVACSPFSTCGQVLKGESNSLFVFKDKITRYQRKIAFSSQCTSMLNLILFSSGSPSFAFFSLNVPNKWFSIRAEVRCVIIMRFPTTHKFVYG